ncbi:MAG: hypothetical protein GX811_05200 [Lentisphaerae bacterium]|jgi:hypothetical protein|nr:hypothetical protein [Lentisphaerota bacterium]
MIHTRVTRVVTAIFICFIGGLLLLINLFGFAMNGPLEPAMGETWEEHYRRIDSGYYRLESAFTMLWLGAYILTVLIPHRWVIQKTSRYRVVMGILLVPLVVLAGSAVLQLSVALFTDRVAFWNRVSWLFRDAIFICFFLPAPISLQASRYWDRRSIRPQEVAEPDGTNRIVDAP